MWKMCRHKLDFGFSLVAFLLDQCFLWWQIGDFYFSVRKGKKLENSMICREFLAIFKINIIKLATSRPLHLLGHHL
jgi:hypothetical protein